MKSAGKHAQKESRLVEIYGSLLNSKQRHRTLSKGEKMEEIGDIKRVGWKLSFDRYSKEHQEAVLNLVETKNKKEIFYTKVFKVDQKALKAITEREMGPKTARKRQKGELIDLNSYRPIKMCSKLGETTIFLIPQEGRRLTATNKRADYVRIVKQGIKRCFEGPKLANNLRMLANAVEQSQPEEIRLHNIVNMGLAFSAMIRLFKQNSKQTLHDEIITQLKNIFQAKSCEELASIHDRFCHWGIRRILLAKKRHEKETGEKENKASYGQIAKTFDVVLKVAVYYAHLPGCRRARLISPWLNAAVDTQMMTFLRKNYPKAIKRWPKTVRAVKKDDYVQIQKIVRRFIEEKCAYRIWPVQFDDIYWKELNK